MATNLPVVLSVAHRHVVGHDNVLVRLIDLLEIGNPVLIDAVDTYDFTRYSSLERYVVWRLMQQFVRERLKAETTLDGPFGEPLTLAHRREPGAAVLDRMIQAAQRRGVTLPVSRPTSGEA